MTSRAARAIRPATSLSIPPYPDDVFSSHFLWGEGRNGRISGTTVVGNPKAVEGLYLDHIHEHRVVWCLELDLEGIVAKPEASPFRELKGKTTWVKVKNPAYSQVEGRR